MTGKDFEIVFAEAGTYGYKKPTLWIRKGNDYTKIGSFESEGRMELFMHILESKCAMKVNDERLNDE